MSAFGVKVPYTREEGIMRDSILLMNIYKRYLQTTSDLVSILERQYVKMDSVTDTEITEKYKEFRKHAHNIIEDLNTNLHKLLRIDWELKELEDNT